MVDMNLTFFLLQIKLCLLHFKASYNSEKLYAMVYSFSREKAHFDQLAIIISQAIHVH